MQPCGYILTTNNYRYFALQCIFCERKCRDWEFFVEHVRACRRTADHQNDKTEQVAGMECDDETTCAFDSQMFANITPMSSTEILCPDDDGLDDTLDYLAYTEQLVEEVDDEDEGDQKCTMYVNDGEMPSTSGVRIHQLVESLENGDDSIDVIEFVPQQIVELYSGSEASLDYTDLRICNTSVKIEEMIETTEHNTTIKSEANVESVQQVDCINAESLHLNMPRESLEKIMSTPMDLEYIYQQRKSEKTSAATDNKCIIKADPFEHELSERNEHDDREQKHKDIISIRDAVENVRLSDDGEHVLANTVNEHHTCNMDSKETHLDDGATTLQEPRKNQIDSKCELIKGSMPNPNASGGKENQPSTYSIDFNFNETEWSNETEDTQFVDSNQSDEYPKESLGSASKFLISFSTNNTATCDFIECYKSHPCLWDNSHINYANAEERDQALQQISNFFAEKYHISFSKTILGINIMRTLTFYKRNTHARREGNPIRHAYYKQLSFLDGIDLGDRVYLRNLSSHKLRFGRLEKGTLGFIDLCKTYPLLWDKKHEHYTDREGRKSAYEQIIAQMFNRYGICLNVDEVVDGIKRMREYHVGVLERDLKNQPLTKSDIVYLDRCQYLPVHDRKMQCTQCAFTTRGEATLQVHMARIHATGTLPHQCGYCDKCFAFPRARHAHEVRFHTKDYKFICPHCSKGFATRGELTKHETIHTGERQFVCEKCGHSFRLKYQLRQHVDVVHDRRRLFKCERCPKSYTRKAQLDDHVRTHFNTRDRICEFCGKGFTNYHVLYRHKLIHLDERRYKCHLCGMAFNQLPGLRQHMRYKHKNVSGLQRSGPDVAQGVQQLSDEAENRTDPYDDNTM